MKKSLLTLAMALFATTGFAQKYYNEVFPADFSSGVPTGWAIGNDAATQVVAGGVKVTCTLQTNDKYRADIKYNMSPNTADDDFYFDASKYKVFAIKFIGERPTSGVLKLQNISVNGDWISNKGEYGLKTGNNQYTGDLVDAQGNHTYYWTLPGESWTGNMTMNKIEIVVADIADANANTYTISQMNWYESEEALKDALGIGTKPVVANQTTGKNYENLTDAWNAAVSGDVLVLNEDVVVKERLNTNSREITIKGEGHTVSRDSGYNGIMFLTVAGKDGDGNTIDGANVIALENVTIDGVNKETNGQTIEAGNWGLVNLNNVKFQNCNTTSFLGVVGVKNGGSLSVNGASFTNCTVPAGFGVIFGGTDGIKVAGSNDATVFLEAGHWVTDNGLNGGKITIFFNPDQNGDYKRTMDAPVVKEVKSAEYFACGVSGYSLSESEGNLVIVEGGSAVSELEADENAPVEYFNLQGVKVANPEKGIYIKRQGNQTFKVIL